MAVLFLERHSLYNSPFHLSLSMLHKDFKQWNKCHSRLLPSFHVFGPIQALSISSRMVGVKPIKL